MNLYLTLFCWSIFGQYRGVIGDSRGETQTYVVVGLHPANWKEEWKYEYESFQYIQGVFEKSKRGNHYTTSLDKRSMKHSTISTMLRKTT